MAAAEAFRPPRREDDRRRRLDAVERLRPAQDRIERDTEPGVGNVDRTGDEGFAALVGHAQDGCVHLEELDSSSGDRADRLLQRQALGERAGDLVERLEAPGREELRVERLLALLRQPGCVLVQAGVLDCDRELPRERGEQHRLVLPEPPLRGQVRDEHADQLAGGAKRDDDGRLDPRLRDGISDRPQARVARCVLHLDDRPRAETLEDQIEKPLGDTDVRAGEPALGRRLEPSCLSEVDRCPVGPEQLTDPVDRRLEGVRKRQLGDCLPDDRQQRPATLELLRQVARPLARPDRMRGAGAEGRQPRELVRARLVSRVEDKAEATDARLAEPDEHDASVERHASVPREQLVRVPHDRGLVGEVLSMPGGRDRLRPPVRSPEDA